MAEELRNPAECNTAVFGLDDSGLTLRIFSCAAHPDLNRLDSDELRAKGLAGRDSISLMVGETFDRHSPSAVDRQVGILGEKCTELCADCPQFKPRFAPGVPHYEPAEILYASGS